MSRKNKIFVIIAVIVAFACIWAFVSAGIITKGFREKLALNKLGMQELNIQNLLVTETKDGKKHWELFAEKGYYDNSGEKAVLEDIVGNFYDKDKVVASFSSTKGTYDKNTKEIVLYDKTLIVYKDGSNVSANKVSWKGKDTDIEAKGNIRLELPSKVIVYAKYATLDSTFKKLKVFGRTRTEIYDKGLKI